MLIENQLGRILAHVGHQLLADGIRKFFRVNVNAREQTALDDISRDLQLRRGNHTQPVHGGLWMRRALGQAVSIRMEEQDALGFLREGHRTEFLPWRPTTALEIADSQVPMITIAESPETSRPQDSSQVKPGWSC